MQSNMLLDETILHGRYLIFGLGEESYGLDIDCITEIVNMQDITRLPQMPSFIKGIINLRGKIVPVMDLRLRFGMKSASYTDWTCIVIVEIQDSSIGLIVDHVLEVMTIDSDQCVPLPSSLSGTRNNYLQAIGKVGSDIKLLLDCSRLLATDEFAFIMEGITE